VAGGGVRTTRDEFINNLNQFVLDPESRRLWVYNAFRAGPNPAQLAAVPDRGVKLERSTFTGFQVLPNLRVAWQPDDRNLVWAAVSRAVRTPSRIDRQLTALPILTPATGFDPRSWSPWKAAIAASHSPTPTCRFRCS
jgi:iron complex outermembrane receptor protein